MVGLKLSFRGTSTGNDQEVNFSAKSKGDDSNYSNDNLECSMLSECDKVFKATKVSESSDCIILLKRGKLLMRNCSITLSMMVKNFKSDLTSVASLEDTELVMEDCEIKGKIDMNCLGMYVNKGNISLKRVTIRDFKRGGLIISNKKTNINHISSCHITFNKSVGILLMGDNKQTIVEDSNIERNECPGIQILPANKSVIRNNSICINTHGIKITSADPTIF